MVGIGGIFFKARDPGSLSEWYRRHLAINIVNNVAVFGWHSGKDPNRKGHTVWSAFPHSTRYFGRRRNQFMIDYRVKNLKLLLRQLHLEGVSVHGKIMESKYGKFAWLTDPEGNHIELWQPPRTYRAQEEEIASE
jgi:predicted enzyme related to lactoylglutathione lyase